MSVFSASKLICAKKYEMLHAKEDSYKDLLMYNRKVFNARQTEALRSLYLWRDGIARQQDESTGYVLPNLMMLQIAEILPRDPEGILACCTHIPPLVHQNLAELHAIIKHARERPIEKKEVPTQNQSQLIVRLSLTKHEYCPHDTSVHSTDSSSSDAAGVPLSNVTVNICEKPMLTAFADVAKTCSKRTDAQCRADAVRNSLSNPFSQYLPRFGPSVSTANADEAAIDVTGRVWKLLPNTVKRAPTADMLPVVEVLETAAKIPFSTVSTPPEPQESNLEKTIRQQLAQERKKVEDVESVSTTKKKRKRRRKRDKSASEKSDVVNSAKSNEAVGRAKAETEFKPHDYSKANLKTLLQAEESASSPAAKKKKKKREFDPNLAIADADYKPVKHRPVHSSANKSMTYGANTASTSSLPKIPWPKR